MLGPNVRQRGLAAPIHQDKFNQMFDTLNSLWLGFSGDLSDNRQARKLVWLLLVVFLFGWVCIVYAAWVSFPSYHAMIEFLPFAPILALTFTVGIASFLYFDLAYIAGFLVERWKQIDPQVRDYTTLGARILGAAAVLFLCVDVYMNMQGAGYRAEDAAGAIVKTSTYETAPAVAGGLADDRQRLGALMQGKLGGYGWRDPKTGIYHLNNSGKRLQRSLSANLARLQAADSTQRAAFLADQAAAQGAREEKRGKAEETLKMGVYGVYVFVFILTIIQAFIVETIQDKTGQNAPSGAASKLKAKAKGKGGLTSTQTAPAMTGSGAGLVTASAKGYEITCNHCGKSAIMKSPRAKYCSEKCRTAAWEQRTGAKLKKGKSKGAKIGYK